MVGLSMLSACSILPEDNNPFNVALDVEPADSPLVGWETNDFGYILNDFNIKEVVEGTKEELPKLDLLPPTVLDIVTINNGILSTVESGQINKEQTVVIAISLLNERERLVGFDVGSDDYLKGLVLPERVIFEGYDDNVLYEKETLKSEKKTRQFLEKAWSYYSKDGELTSKENHYVKSVLEFIEQEKVVFVDEGSASMSINGTWYNERDILQIIQNKIYDTLTRDGYMVILTSDTVQNKGFRDKGSVASNSQSEIHLVLDIQNNDRDSVNGVSIYTSTKSISFTEDKLKKMLDAIVSSSGISIDTSTDIDGVYGKDTHYTEYSIPSTSVLTLGGRNIQDMSILIDSANQIKIADAISNSIKEMFPR